MVGLGVGVPYPPDVHGRFAHEGAAHHGDPPSEEGVGQGRLGDAGQGVGRATAEESSSWWTGKTVRPARLWYRLSESCVDGLAAQRRRDQEGAVGAGAVGQPVGEHQVQQQRGLGGGGACRHPVRKSRWAASSRWCGVIRGWRAAGAAPRRGRRVRVAGRSRGPAGGHRCRSGRRRGPPLRRGPRWCPGSAGWWAGSGRCCACGFPGGLVPVGSRLPVPGLQSQQPAPSAFSSAGP